MTPGFRMPSLEGFLLSQQFGVKGDRKGRARQNPRGVGIQPLGGVVVGGGKGRGGVGKVRCGWMRSMENEATFVVVARERLEDKRERWNFR